MPFKGPVALLQTSGFWRGGRDRISRAAGSGESRSQASSRRSIDSREGVKVPNLGSGRRGAEAHHGASRVRTRDPSPNEGFAFRVRDNKGHVVLHGFRVMSIPVDLERRAHIFTAYCYCLLLLLTSCRHAPEVRSGILSGGESPWPLSWVLVACEGASRAVRYCYHYVMALSLKTF